jgi:hypothetical protein
VFVWAYWAISATEVTIATGGSTVTRSYTGAMFIGLIAAALMVLLLVESIFELFGLGDSNAT